MNASLSSRVVLSSLVLLTLTACSFSYPPGPDRSESRPYRSYNPYASNSTRGPAHAFFGSEGAGVGSSLFQSEAEEKRIRARSIRRYANNGRCDDGRYRTSNGGHAEPGTDEADCQRYGDGRKR